MKFTHLSESYSLEDDMRLIRILTSSVLGILAMSAPVAGAPGPGAPLPLTQQPSPKENPSTAIPQPTQPPAAHASDGLITVTAPTVEDAEEILGAAQKGLEAILKGLGLDAKDGNLPPLPPLNINVVYTNAQGGWAGFTKEGAIVIGKTDLSTALESLNHELTHYVVKVHFAKLPIWCNESMACMNSSPSLQKTFTRTTAWYPRTKKWPPLSSVINVSKMTASDAQEYALAYSLGRFLTEGQSKSKDTLVKFALAAKNDGLAPALQQFYGIKDQKELQTLWQDWVSKTTADPADDLH